LINDFFVEILLFFITVSLFYLLSSDYIIKNELICHFFLLIWVSSEKKDHGKSKFKNLIYSQKRQNKNRDGRDGV